MAACSPSDNTAPGEEEVQIPVLEEGDTVHFTLLQTTDVHHHAVGTGPSASYGTENDTTLGGYSRLARRILTIRGVNDAAGIPTVLVDSGDYFMGTVYDMSLASSPAALMFFESMDYDAITIGNHELDYGPTPLAGFFSLAIGEYPVSKFNVPVIASNMVTHGNTGIDALKTAGVIKDSLIRTLDNGLKVGIIGLLGKNAASDAPVKAPLTFTNDLSNNAVVAEIQAKVNALRNDGAHVVIALSHSGITDPDGTPGGDDVTLAQKVTGIDIIASGHEHQRTSDVVVVNGTRIICAGKYGEYLAQLDVTVTVGTGVTDADLAPADESLIDSDLVQFGFVQVFLVGALDAGINEAIVAKGLPEVNDIVAGTNSNNMAIPEGPAETGIGNLAADSIRYLLGGAQGNPSLGIVANGVVRNGYAQGQQISFADIYNTLPLGMTLDPANQTIPGYPLVMIYLNQTSILNLCKLAALTLAAHDDVFMTSLLNSGVPAYVQQYYLLLNLKSDYYLNFSGVRYTHGQDYSVTAGNVYLYGATDFSCQSAAAIPIAALGANPIPCVLDLYTALMFLDPSMQALLAAAGLTINPLVMVDGVPVALSQANLLSARLDRDTEAAGVQEVKEWMGLLQYVTNTTAQLGLNSVIADSKYGSAALATGNASRVNVVVPD
jgi:5'-nucleotidase